jgi:hypothetical protein
MSALKNAAASPPPYEIAAIGPPIIPPANAGPTKGTPVTVVAIATSASCKIAGWLFVKSPFNLSKVAFFAFSIAVLISILSSKRPTDSTVRAKPPTVNLFETTLIDAFSNYKNHELLKSNLQAIHDEIETEQFNFKTPLKVVESTESNIITLIKKYKTIAVAAAVAVFTVSASILFFNLSGADGGKQQTAFQELRREVESIKRKQKAIIQDINDETKSAEVLPDRSFTGAVYTDQPGDFVIKLTFKLGEFSEVFQFQ